VRLTKASFLLLLLSGIALSQTDTGEIRLQVNDATGLPLPSSGTLMSQAANTRRTFETDGAGRFAFLHLAPGPYRLTVEHPGFTASVTLVEVRSAGPNEVRISLSVAAAPTEIVVTDSATLLDPHRTGVAYAVGTQQVREQQSAMPARGLLDLVNMQPGWLFESNAVLHPRGSESQTLFVVDGVPMDENRSPGFAPGLQAAEVAGISVLTGNYPAEYGRKLGGVIEVVTGQDNRPGFHGSAELGGGSFGTVSGFLSGTYGWKRSAFTLSASREHTDRYLDPPVAGNYTNTGNLDGLTAVYDRDLSDSDRIHLSAYRRQSMFEVPNENLQRAGSLQPRRFRAGSVDAGILTAPLAERPRRGRGPLGQPLVKLSLHPDRGVSRARIPPRLSQLKPFVHQRTS